MAVAFACPSTASGVASTDMAPDVEACGTSAAIADFDFTAPIPAECAGRVAWSTLDADFTRRTV
eukprot:5444226-Prymnesium_polylepis.1